MARAAHTLKGSVGNLAAEKAAAAAQSVEDVGKSGNFTFAEQAFLTLESELKLVGARLRKLNKSSMQTTKKYND